MDQEHGLSQDEVFKAQQFHLQHFPNQDVPTIKANKAGPIQGPEHPLSEDLGLYPNGTRRTLTDEQIVMFRHSEIQRLLAERRRQNEAQEDKRQQETERQHTRRRHDPLGSSVPTRYHSDTMVHASDDVNELSYEESNIDSKDRHPNKFQWPVLGS